jgi:hypothetical protein
MSHQFHSPATLPTGKSPSVQWIGWVHPGATLDVLAEKHSSPFEELNPDDQTCYFN